MGEIEIQNLSFTYENRHEPALESIKLDFDSREFVLLAGASGSGKSTLLKCINGLIPHRYVGEYSGTVKLKGRSVAESTFLDLALTVGTVLQEADKQLVSSIVEDDVAFGPGNLALPREEIARRVDQSLTEMDVLNLAHRPVYALSGGQKQRIAIADILAMESGIMLFDEPLANLDSNGIKLMQGIMKQIHRGGRTIIVAEHRTEEVIRANPTRVIVIDHGRVVADSTDPHIISNFKGVLKVPAQYLLPDWTAERIQAKALQKISQVVERKASEVSVKNGLIQVRDLVVDYPGGVRALDGISLAVGEGERIALLGNNGAGKSTLALCMIGLLKPNRGQVLVGGEDTRNLTPADIAKNVCLVFQNPFSMLFAKTVREELSFGPRNLGFDQSRISTTVPDTAKHCSVDHLLDGSPFASSFGEKKRICVASVLTMGPRCIILDEPTAGQDYRSYTSFMNFINSLSEHVKSFIIITHDPDLAIDFTDRAVVLRDGKVIADGPTRAVLADSSILSQGAIRETSLIELSRKITAGKTVLTTSELLDLASA